MILLEIESDTDSRLLHGCASPIVIGDIVQFGTKVGCNVVFAGIGLPDILAEVEWNSVADELWLFSRSSQLRPLLGGSEVIRAQLRDGDRFVLAGVAFRVLFSCDPNEVEVAENNAASMLGEIHVLNGDARDLRGALRALAESAEAAGIVRDQGKLRQRLLDLIFAVLDVDRAVIARIAEPGSTPFVLARRHARRTRAREEVMKISGTVVSRVLESGQPLLIESASTDMQSESVREFGIGTILCAPLANDPHGKSILYLDTVGRHAILGEEGRLIFRALAAIVGNALAASAALSLADRKSRELLRDLSAATAGKLIHQSPVMERLIALADRFARSPDQRSPILLTGETGTGKSQLAAFLHARSPRRDRALIHVNCAELNDGNAESILFGSVRGAFTGAENRPGHFQAAEGGTLFLDEIGELNSTLQAKLFVALDGSVTPVGAPKSSAVNVRVISATSRDLEQMVKDGDFRLELFRRLCTLPLYLPPLRERREDIPALARHFLARFGGEWEDGSQSPTAFSLRAIAALESWDWPGNVGELENVVRHAIALASSECVEIEHLPPALRSRPLFPCAGFKTLEQIEADAVRLTLERTAGNQSAAARILGINRNTLREKMVRHGLVQ